MNGIVRRPQYLSAVAGILAGCTMAAIRMRQGFGRPQLPPPQPQWMALDQAARYTGLSEGFIRRLIAGGKLMAIDDGGPKVRRVDLDRLEGLGSAVGELRKAMRARR
jgi:excisionase family DNA binding protein